MSAPAEPEPCVTSQQRFDAALTRWYQPLTGAAVRVNFCVLLVEQGDWIRAVKPAEPPVSMQRLLLVFWSVTVPEGGGGGVALTVSVAAVVVAHPAAFVNSAWY